MLWAEGTSDAFAGPPGRPGAISQNADRSPDGQSRVRAGRLARAKLNHNSPGVAFCVARFVFPVPQAQVTTKRKLQGAIIASIRTQHRSVNAGPGETTDCPNPSP